VFKKWGLGGEKLVSLYEGPVDTNLPTVAKLTAS